MLRGSCSNHVCVDIQQSAVVLIFLSKNYFCSLNWCGSYLFTAFTSHRTVLTWSGLRWPFNAQYHADERRLGAPLMRCVRSLHCSLREARAAAQEDKVLTLVWEADPRCGLFHSIYA